MEEFSILGLDMQTYTKLTAAFLGLLGITFYIITDMASISALIPTFIGIPLFLMAYLTEQIPEKKSLFMHIAVSIGVICAAGGVTAIKSIIDGDLTPSNIEKILLMLTGIEYTTVCVFSFIHTRKQREA